MAGAGRAVRLAAGSLLAATLCTTQAAAQSVDDAPDLAGRWRLATGSYSNECSLAGVMTVSARDSRGERTCSLAIHETCRANGHETDAVESCVMRQDGRHVTIRSTIEKLVRQKPDPYAYAPDHFALTLTSADQMMGSLLGVFVWARFERDREMVS